MAKKIDKAALAEKLAKEITEARAGRAKALEEGNQLRAAYYFGKVISCFDLADFYDLFLKDNRHADCV
ncbi:hypothetical protein [Ralstonia phage RSP15]|uniref:hypothetical protein n=1 Tax=Ralstonia phage RSP15 TaxID=1785960 RepID=UPI00074D4787|nr:hypothetical protein BH754_gp145 [Ralstonia phage RSP15]BAU40161.1 hypothetical protein [Ralstonia phage RSP15]